MRTVLAKDLAERDARSRDNKRFFQGRVLFVNTINYTLRVQVGDGEIIEEVPYTPQSPPNIGDIVPLEYASSSVHSIRAGIGRLSGQNSSDQLYVVGKPQDHGHTSSSGDGGELDTPSITNYTEFTEVSAPGTPAAGKVRVYAKSDNKMYRKGEDGVEYELGGWFNQEVVVFDGDGGASPTGGGDSLTNRKAHFCSNGGDAWQLNLPAAAAGNWVYVRHYGNGDGTVIIKAAAGDAIEGVSTFGLAKDESVKLIAMDSDNWLVVTDGKLMPEPPGADIQSLFYLAPSTKDLIFRKVKKGKSTESDTVSPLYGVLYQPTNDDRVWARYWLASKSGASAATCAARPIRITMSELYADAIESPTNIGVGQDANFAGGAQSYAPAVTIETSDATNRTEVSGSWSTSAAAPNTPIGRFSATAGAQVQYTVTGASRILWRGRGNTTNGGLVSVVITESAVEIDDSQYEAPDISGTRTVNEQYFTTTVANPSTKVAYIPLARDLDDTKTYIVTLTQVSNRIYDHGILGYLDADDDAGYPYNQTGYTGTWDRYDGYYAATGNNYAACYYAGSRIVYFAEDCSRIYWKHVKRANGSYAAFRVYESDGTPVDLATYGVGMSVHANGEYYIDTYRSASAEFETMILDGLPLGDYYVHIFSLGDRSVAFTEIAGASQATGSKWAVYTGDLHTADTATAGSYPTDSFIDSDKQYGGGGTDPQDEAGNYLWAGQVRYSGDPNLSAESGQASFVTGVHGAESYPSNIVVRVDGAAISYSGAAQGTEWTGAVIEMEFDTTVGTQGTPGTPWANLHYYYKWTASEFIQRLTMETVADVYHGTWYACITQDAGNSSATNGTMLGLGFDRVLVDLVGTAQVEYSGAAGAPNADSSYTHSACLMSDADQYGYITKQNRPWTIWDGTQDPATHKHQYSTRAKVYGIVKNDPTAGGAGTLLPSGYRAEWEYSSRFLYTDLLATI